MKITKTAVCVCLSLLFVATPSFALPITYSYTGIITTGSVPNQPFPPPFPQIPTGTTFSGQFGFDNLTTPDFGGNIAYSQSTPFSLSLGLYTFSVPGPTWYYLPDSIQLYGSPHNVVADGLFIGPSPGFSVLYFYFPFPVTPGTIPDFSQATSMAFDWDAPVRSPTGGYILGTINSVTPLPLPSSLVMLGSGFVGLVLYRYRRRG